MDAFKEADEDGNFEFEELSDYDGDASNVSLTVDADKYIINNKEKVNKLCSEDFYKDDYELMTRGLISDDIRYDMVIYFYKELMERVFAQK